MGPVTAAAAEAAAEEAWAASAVRAASASVDLAAISAASASAEAAAAATAIAQQEVDAALAASADSGAAAAAEATAAAASRPGTAAWLGAQELLDYCNAHPGAASDVAEAGAECVASRSDCMAQRLPGQVLFEQYVRQTATRIGRATVGVLRSDLHKPGNQRVEEVLRLAGLSDGSSTAFEVAAPAWDVTFKNITLTSVGNDFDVRASRLLRLPGVLCRVSRSHPLPCEQASLCWDNLEWWEVQDPLTQLFDTSPPDEVEMTYTRLSLGYHGELLSLSLSLLSSPLPCSRLVSSRLLSSRLEDGRPSSTRADR